MTPRRVLIDTSVLVAREVERPLRQDPSQWQVHICVVTLAEIKAGVLLARDVDQRVRRLTTLESLDDVPSLPIDEEVAAEWAVLRASVAERGRRVNINDLWIAATALRFDMPVVTQDSDFFQLSGVRGLEVIQI
jgi:predicted nucleic acid-binding protein